MTKRTSTPGAAADGWRNRIVGEGEVAAGELVPHPQNWRKHPKEQAANLTGTLDGVGWVQRVIVNKRTGRMLDGHLRAELARRQGEATPVPVVYVDLSDDEERTVLATLDPIAGMAIADEATLAGLVRSIEDADLRSVAGTIAQTLNVDVDGKGDTGKDTEAQVDRAEELRQKWGVEPGQLWQLGEHRLICGDCTDAAVVARVIGGEKAGMMLTDPPYGVKRDKGFEGFEGFGGFGPPISRRQYADDWDSDRPSQQTLRSLIESAENSIVFGGNFFADILPRSTHWIVWDKQNTMPTFGDCELAWTDVARQSVKKYSIVYNGLIGKEKDRFHPTQKPVALMAAILSDYTNAGAIVFDPFLGSGTTLIACENLGRRCRAVEIAPGYVAVALERFHQHSGKVPVIISGE